MSLAFFTYGDKGKPPLVLLHGWGMSSAVWGNFLLHLVDDYYVLAVDLPGLGQSGDATPTDLDDAAKQVFTVVDEQLGGQPAFWFGWSLGGLVSAEVASQYPDKLRGLVTLSTNPRFVGGDIWPGMDKSTFAAFQKSLTENADNTLKRFVMLISQGHDSPRFVSTEIRDYLEQNPTPSVEALATCLSWLEEDNRALFDSLEVPRLHLFADQDALVPLAVTQTTCLRGKADVIRGSGHAPFVDQPDTLAAILRSFVRSQGTL